MTEALALKTNELSLIECRLKEALGSNSTHLNSYFSNFLFNDAKRLRPILIFLICDFLSVNIDEDILNFACAIELFHSASLIHDDILDDARVRRNLPCIHIEKSLKEAVLAGDYLLGLGMEFISKIKEQNLTPLMAQTTLKMTMSEINALEKRFSKQTLEEYLDLIDGKTTALFEACALGVFKIKKLEADKNILNFVRKFSLCFQIQDDINNFLKIEKNKLSSDVEAGVNTLPVILGIENAYKYFDSLKDELKEELVEYQNKNDLLKLLELFKRNKNERE